MRAWRVVAGSVGAIGISLVIACASFGVASDAGGPVDAQSADITTADAPVDSVLCGTLDDEFDRAANEPAGGPWTTLITDSQGSSATIVSDTVGNILQTQAVATNGSPKTFAYLQTTLSPIPKTLTCSFALRPDTSFKTSNDGPGTGPGLDAFVIVVSHADDTKTLLRFSYKTGDIELRADTTDENDICLDPTNAMTPKTCPAGDTSKPGTGMGQNIWTNLVITTDFSTVTVNADTNGTTASVSRTYTVGTPTQVDLYLGLINFSNSTQLGSYDHFHCDLHC